MCRFRGGGGGGGGGVTGHKSIGFLRKFWSRSPEKSAFNVFDLNGVLLTADDGPLIVVFESSLPSSTVKAEPR